MHKHLNKEYIAWHLEEAAKEIANTLREMESETDWEIGSFSVGMRQVFHHANSAWNGRYATDTEADECRADDFEKWRQYPADLEVI